MECAAPSSVVEQLKTYLVRAKNHRFRLPLIISGERSWCRAQLVMLVDSLPAGEKLWLGSDPLEGWQQGSIRSARNLLGQEFSSVIHNGWEGFNPDCFAQASGLVKAGGLYILLLPPLGELSDWLDPEYQSLQVEPSARCRVDHRFLRRMLRVIDESDSLLLLRGEGLRSLLIKPTVEPICCPDPQSHYQSEDQKYAVELALKRLKRGRRPVVLMADRGRGKSSALGLIAADIVVKQQRPVYLTSPNSAACLAVQQRFSERLPDQTLPFYPAHQLLQLPSEGVVLLVDEAAGFSPELLYALLEKFPRIVFATTLQGYEGTGQGFALRFMGRLKQLRPEWRSYQLKQPIRWAEGDLLERFTAELLLLRVTGVESALGKTDLSDVQIVKVNRDQLVENEGLLASLFALLINAHYRTTPSDLRILLDGANIHLWLALSDGEVVGVLQVVVEGGLPEELCHSIRYGSRRPRGNLLAQIQIAQLGDMEAGVYLGGRVMRVAVADGFRRAGVATALMDQLSIWATEEKITYLGASFAASEGLLSFWKDQGYLLIDLGEQIDTTTGALSTVVMKGVTPRYQKSVQIWYQRVSEQLSWWLIERYADQPLSLVKSLLRHTRQSECFDPWDIRQLENFAYGKASLARVRVILRRLLVSVLSKDPQSSVPDEAVLSILLGKQVDTGDQDWQRSLKTWVAKQIVALQSR